MQIPYAKRVPLRARTRAWTTLERNGAAVRVERPGGQRADPGAGHPRDRGVRQRRVERLVLEHVDHRGLQLPRDHRQHVGHGALLLHPLRLPDVLQEHLRRARSRPSTWTRAGRPDVGSGSNYSGEDNTAQVRGLLLRAVLHDQLAVERLQGHHDRVGADQLPLPDRQATRSCCSTRSWSRSCPASTATRPT